MECPKCGANSPTGVDACQFCGSPMTVAPAAEVPAAPQQQAGGLNPMDKNLHLTLIIAAGVGVLLLYTSFQITLIGLATGVACGLSWRLFGVQRGTSSARARTTGCSSGCAPPSR